MHARVRAHDWAATPLGQILDWPQSLKFAVNSTLAAGFPTLLLWSRDLLQFYNDAYLRLMDWREVPLGASYKTSWPEDVAATAAIFERAWRGETVVLDETPYSNERRDDGRPIWLNTNVSPAHDEMGNVAGLCLSIFDSTDRILAQAALREKEEQLSQILELLPVGVSLFGADGEPVRANREMQRLFDTGPHPVGAVQRLVFDQNGRPLERDEYPAVRALRGEAVRPEADLLIERGGAKRWFKVGAVPLVRDGKITGGIATTHDITEAKENADRLKVLVAELQHRTRNLIAVVRSLADKTLEGSASLDDFRTKFLTRLAALARVQGLLFRPKDGGKVAFDELLRAELAAYSAFDEARARVTLHGPVGVPLRSSMVQTFALALHELATNAAKHGALAQPAARLAVRWHLEPESDLGQQHLCVDWCESGVAMPQAGARSGSGYGRELIEHALPYHLGVKTTYNLGADGVHCTLCLPIGKDALATRDREA